MKIEEADRLLAEGRIDQSGWNEIVGASTTPTTQVTVGAGESEFQKQQGKRRSDVISKSEDELASLQEQMDVLSVMEEYVNTPGLYTGPGETLFKLKNIQTQLFGSSPELAKANNAAAVFRSFSNQLALQAATKLKGQMSDRDVEFIKNTVPTLTNTPEQNKELIRIYKKLLNRKQQMERLKIEFLASGGKLYQWPEYQQEFVESNPLFGRANTEVAGETGRTPQQFNLRREDENILDRIINF